MPRQTGITIENDFTRGLITEGTTLNIPENAATEIFDVEMTSKNKWVRRKGFEFEVNNATKTVDRTGVVTKTYLWENASGDGEINLLVAQIGTKLHFWQATDPVSANPLTPTVDLTAYSPAGADSPGLEIVEFTEGNGVLFVTHPQLETFYLTYVSLTSITETQVNPQIRDLEGVDDTADAATVDTRPSHATVAAMEADSEGVKHAYNLYNQSWAFEGGTGTAPIDTWDSARTDMPSNVDVWWAYKNSSGVFATAEINNVDLGNTPAPKGHFILSIYDEDRDTASGLTGVPGFSTGAIRASTASFFGSRLWLSSVKYKGRQSNVYYSQVVEGPDQYGRMYQQNDPTVEDLSDLVASDGGVVTIQDSGTIHKLFNMQQALLVFASRGVWAITGSTGVGFAADDFTVVKISSIGVTQKKSFVQAEGNPYWWNEDGIYTAVVGDQGIQVVSLTDETIKSFINDIPRDSRRNVRGTYNSDLRRIQWLYRSTEPGTVDEENQFDRTLNFYLKTSAFVPWRISAGDTKVHDIFVTVAPNQLTQEDTVIASGVNTSTVTFSVASPGKVNWTGHNMANDDIVQFTTTGTLPAALSLATDYYVQNQTANDFEVSLTAGGTSINFADAGSGTHTGDQQNTTVIQSTSGDTVIANTNLGLGIDPGFKYFVSYDNGASSFDFTVAETRLTTYLDWTLKEGTGIDYTSTITTGYKIRGDTMRKQQSPYIQVYMDEETNASCLMQGLWDWSNDSSTGKQTAQQQCYNSSRQNFDVNFRKLKLRGTGRSLQLKFDSETGKPFTLAGWAQLESVSADV